MLITAVGWLIYKTDLEEILRVVRYDVHPYEFYEIVNFLSKSSPFILSSGLGRMVYMGLFGMILNLKNLK